MENSLEIALSITAIGMTLLFLALALFYGLVSVLTIVARDRDVSQASRAEEGERPEQEAMLRAAVIGVAMARAEVEQESEGIGSSWQEGKSTGDQVSSWWMLHHQRQLLLNVHWRGTR
ncbi:MAG: hypothetical protein ACUVWZ_13010 [Anaerolineae bacterium]